MTKDLPMQGQFHVGKVPILPHQKVFQMCSSGGPFEVTLSTRESKSSGATDAERNSLLQQRIPPVLNAGLRISHPCEEMVIAPFMSS